MKQVLIKVRISVFYAALMFFSSHNQLTCPSCVCLDVFNIVLGFALCYKAEWGRLLQLPLHMLLVSDKGDGGVGGHLVL